MVAFRLALALALATIGLAQVSAAFAYQTTTRWYSIDIMPATNSIPGLFLTNTADGVRLERYRSGDPTQQWAIVHMDYPSAPRVTGSGPLDGIIENCTLFDGCSFQGRGGGVRKFVNRASGACLVFRTVADKRKIVVTEPCSAADDSVILRQTWGWIFSDSLLTSGAPPNTDYTSLASKFQGRFQCLESAAKQNPDPAGSATRPSNCGSGWFQNFRFLQSAQLTCTTNWQHQICFVSGQ